MTQPAPAPDGAPQAEALRAILESQREAFWAELPVPAATRIDRIQRAIDLLVDHQKAFSDAMAADYGRRPEMLTRLADIMGAVNHLKHARKHLKAWMKPERRPMRFPLGLLGARARIEYQPLGVVGIITPWNFPLLLSFGPMADAMAAGNRCMIKPSEFTPHTSALIAERIAERFHPDEVSVVLGGPEVGQAFAALPFDHLLFTGSTAVGRHIMRAAAENLTPVTLELGGKSPTVIGRTADLDDAAAKIVLGKLLNAGQACLAPDYLLVPRESVEPLVSALRRQVQRMFPDGTGSSDYTAIASDRQWQRLQGYLDELKDSGVRFERMAEDGDHRRMGVTVVVEPPEDSQLMCQEIFGPILPILAYDHIDEVIDTIRSRERPLGLYYFGRDRDECRYLLDRTIAGGVTLNDVMFHISVDDLPFGGVGASGMGAYHGIEGFRRFSHAKSVFVQSRLDVAGLMGMVPPWGKRLAATLNREIRK